MRCVSVQGAFQIGATVPGFSGFAVGQTLWNEALSDHLAGRSSAPEAARTIAAVVSAARDRDATVVEVTEEAEARWIAPMADSGRLLADPDCTPGYYNNEGGPIGRRERLNSAGYPEGAPAYLAYIGRWRTSGGFEGLVFA